MRLRVYLLVRMQEERVAADGPVRVVPRTSGIESAVSIERGRGPVPGATISAYFWGNVLEGPPPARHRFGEGAYSLYHGLEVDADTRIMYSTRVALDPGNDLLDESDNVIHIDSRVSVQKRALLELMDRERAFMDRVSARWREAHIARMVRHRRAANRLRYSWAIDAAVRVVRLEARAGLAFIRSARRTVRGVVQVPDFLITRSLRAYHHLAGPVGRRALVQGLRDPSKLSIEEKSVVLFLSSVLLVALVFILNTLFALLLPSLADAYRGVFADAAISLLSTLALPLAVEPLIAFGVESRGPVLAVLGFFLGKMIGVWLLYFLGDSLYDELQKTKAKRPRIGRAIEWVNRNADRYGFSALVLVNAIPLVPDVLLYAFAVAGMRFRPFVAGIAIGTAIKFAAVVVGVYVIGPDRVTGLVT